MFRHLRSLLSRGRDDPEFWITYQAPGALYLGRALAVGAFTILLFCLVDAIYDLPASPFTVRQIFRAGTSAVMAGLSFYILTHRSFVTKNYVIFANVIGFASLQTVAYIAYISRYGHNVAEVFWALTSTLSTAIIIIFGFYRLRSFNTALIVIAGVSAGCFYAWLYGGFDGALYIRLVVHLTQLTLAGYVIRATIETREYENHLSKLKAEKQNIYAAELELAKATAEEASNIKDRFLANMSHEVRTPMSGILQTLDVLYQDKDAKHRDLIDKGRRAGDALMHILTRILDYTKLAHHADVVNRSAVHLPTLCGRVIDLFSAAAATKGIDLVTKFDLAEASVNLDVDEVKLYEVLNNLLSNALKFTSSGFVELKVCVVAPNDQDLDSIELIVEVRDTGPGIAPEDQSKVFLPFVQLDSSSSRRIGGTGLGLSIVKELVTLMGGRISVHSAPRVGSSFVVCIPAPLASTCEKPADVFDDHETGGNIVPIRPSHRHDIAESPFRPQWGEKTKMEPSVRGASSPGARILLVDDNNYVGGLTEVMLREGGHIVARALDGPKAVQLFRERDFDLVLMDCHMPEMDGYAVTTQMRQYEHSIGRVKQVPIVALTASGFARDRASCLAAGMNDLFTKPLLTKDVSTLISKWAAVAGETNVHKLPT